MRSRRVHEPVSSGRGVTWLGSAHRSPPMRVPSALALAASLLLVASGHAAQDQAPSFRTSVDLVQVDVSVLDGNRRPVEGLTAADFTVREDGKPRAVTAFSAVELESRQPLVGAAPWTRDIAPDLITN